jgi:hypothetical protein
MASINREAGDGYRQVASFGYPPEFTEFMKKNLIPAGRGSVGGGCMSARHRGNHPFFDRYCETVHCEATHQTQAVMARRTSAGSKEER